MDNTQPKPKPDHSKEWLIAWAALLLLLNAHTRGLTPAQQRRARLLLRDKFGVDALRLAEAVIGGSITVAAWQAALAQASGDYARQMAVAGAGTLPSAEVQDAIETAIDAQQPFLEGFAAAIVAGGLSVAATAARSRLYGGVGYAAHWQAAAANQGDFTIVFYEARDDGIVCGPCLGAERGSPYRAGSSPLPGDVCLGGGYCRCTLRFEVNRAVWESLG